MVGPTAVSVDATVVSPDRVTSPFGQLRAAVIRLDLLEADRTLGSLVLGDTLVLEADVGTITLVAIRSSFEFFDRLLAPVPLLSSPPEVVPLMRAATGVGVLGYVEHALHPGGRVRLQAIIEATGPRTFVARHDLGPVVVAEALRT